MSGLQFVHVACAGSYLAIAVYVLWRTTRLLRAAGVAAISVAFAVWSASLMLAHDPDATRDQAELGYHLGVLGWGSFGSLAVVAGLAFTADRARLRSPAVRLALVVPPVVFMVAQWRGVLAADYIHQPWGWAFAWSGSPMTWLFYAYYTIGVGLGLSVVGWRAWRSTDPIVRRQGFWVVGAALVPLVCANTTDVILPWLDIHTIPNVAPAFLLVWIVGVAVAIVRYQLLELTPEVASHQILAAMRDGLLLVDDDGLVIDANRAAADVLGKSPVGAPITDLLGAPTAPGDPDRELTTATERTVMVSCSSVHDAADRPRGSVWLLRDVTDQKRAERALREASRDLEQRVAERTAELARTNVALEALQAVVAAIHRAEAPAEVATSVARAVVPLLAVDGGCRVVLDGDHYDSSPFRELANPVRCDIVAGRQLRGVIEVHCEPPELSSGQRDTLERIARETAQALAGFAVRNAIAQADRLASIGVLAAGVAHEINNPLTYLMIALADLERTSDPPDRERVIARARQASEASHRIARVVRELGSFARDADDVRPIPIVQPIDAAVAMAAHQVRHRAQVAIEIAADAVVRGDLGRLTQVFLNLLVNAGQAIGEGNADANWVTVKGWTTAESVIVTVSDTGRGIPSDALSRIFDPFYSTKRVGEGSGLGLAICHKIVRAYGGTITAANVPGGGARFEVSLPRHIDAAPRARPTPPLIAAPRNRGVRVLIIDDDRQVASALADVLAHHEVETVSSGVEATRRLEGGAAFDVLLCDVMMPEMTGVEVYQWVLSHRRELAPRIIFTTGGAFTSETAAFCQRHAVRVLHKPFDLGELERVVDQVARGSGISSGHGLS